MASSGWTDYTELIFTSGNWITASQGIVEPLMMIDNEQPHQELVKCVVVGDTAVGKTRLICARACNKRMSLSQLLTTHVPTVWAIDQYRMCKDVLERSWEVVDGVNVSLRLWDTFGDHEKDRRFAYGRSDVVLLCFSLANPMSLRNCKAMWFPEIRQFCPDTPILLVGCKNDLRYMFRDETYLTYFRDRNPFMRPVQKCDLVMPDEARAIAREFGAHYYETSVLTYFGVNQVFENSIRAALIARRNQRFWMTNLRKVQKPQLQSPYCPPKPIPPPVQIHGSSYEENMTWLYQQKPHTDVIFVADGSTGLSAHKFILAAASPVFCTLFMAHDEAVKIEIGSSSSESSLASNFVQVGEADDKDYLVQIDEKSTNLSDDVKRRSTSNVVTPLESKRSATVRAVNFSQKKFNHPVFLTVELESNGSNEGCETPDCSHTIITLSNLISSATMAQCLRFLYTGTIDPNFTMFQELRQAAKLMEFPDLLRFINNIQSNNEFLNVELKQRYQMKFRKRLLKLCLEENAFSDIIFQFDDGAVAAHRALLSARCDVMRAMFSGNFMEKDAKIVFFPGVSLDTFYQLLTFLYMDDIKPVSSAHCLDVIELANRLCLTRLINLVENSVINELNKFTTTENPDIIQLCLKLLETCKLHNAHQLADWCMIYLCVNYNKLCKMSSKLLKGLHAENQEYLMEHRWPPVWYLKASDYYVKHASERQKEDKALFKRTSSNSKCLCFGNNSNHDKPSPQQNESPITVTWKIR